MNDDDHPIIPIEFVFVAFYAVYGVDENGEEYPEWCYEWKSK